MERIDKFISDRTPMSRKDVKLLLKQGGVTVNGQTVKAVSYTHLRAHET